MKKTHFSTVIFNEESLVQPNAVTAA